MKNLALGLSGVALLVGLLGLFSGLGARREFGARAAQWEALDGQLATLNRTDSQLQQGLQSLRNDADTAFRNVGGHLESLRNELAALTARGAAATVKPVAPESPKPAVARTSGRKHTVAEGDTLQRIANRYSVSLQAVLDANPGIDPRRIRIGQDVYLP